jgi:hypothetical protein
MNNESLHQTHQQRRRWPVLPQPHRRHCCCGLTLGPATRGLLPVSRRLNGQPGLPLSCPPSASISTPTPPTSRVSLPIHRRTASPLPHPQHHRLPTDPLHAVADSTDMAASALRSGFHRAVAGMISPGVHRSDAMMPPPYANPEPQIEEIDSVAFNLEFNLSLSSPPRDHIFWESQDAEAWYLPLDPTVRPDIFQDDARISDPSIVTCLAHQRLIVGVSDFLEGIQHDAGGQMRCLFLVSRPRQPFNAVGSDKTPSLAVSFTGPRRIIRQCRMLTMNNFPIMVRDPHVSVRFFRADFIRPPEPSLQASRT